MNIECIFAQWVVNILKSAKIQDLRLISLGLRSSSFGYQSDSTYFGNL